MNISIAITHDKCQSANFLTKLEEKKGKKEKKKEKKKRKKR